MKGPLVDKPSETFAGRSWLENFPDPDRVLAEKLVDSLEIHDHVKVLNAIHSKLIEMFQDQPHRLPCVLIPIRSQEDLKPIPVTGHVAYATFDPGANLPVLAGSEADVGNVIRTLTEERPDEFLPPATDIYTLKKLKVRSMALVTDYCGSGKQATSFADTFLRNRTLASWISARNLEISVLAYASSLSGINSLRAKKGITFHTVIAARSIDLANWSPEQRQRIVDLCLRYSDPESTNPPLGYKDSFGLHLTNLRVPNNLPQILIRSGGDWPGLFPGRSIPLDFYRQLNSYDPPVSLEGILRNNRGGVIAERVTERERPIPGLRALAFLHLLSIGLSEQTALNMLKLSEAEQVELRTSLISMGLITLDCALTQSGHDELKRNSWKAFKPPRARTHRGNYVEYIPTQLR